MDIKRAYKYRFHPNPAQEVILARTFGCARFAYNYMLRLRTDALYQDQKRISYNDTSSELTKLKREPEYEWLSEVSSVPVQQSLRHLQSAFTNFFAKRAEYPKFHSKHGAQSASYVATAFSFNSEKRAITLAKMSEPLDIRWSRTIPKKAKGTRIERSQNFRKVQRKIARVHARITDSRRDFQHKLSTKLIRENQTISVETLAVKNMIKSAKGASEAPGRKVKQKSGLNKSILDSSWSEFIRQLEYKALWYGRTLIGIDRWYPSSKRCSECGFTMNKMPLSVREWVCPECGVIHDRDINAARNILAAGLAVSALGESVSPGVTC